MEEISNDLKCMTFSKNDISRIEKEAYNQALEDFCNKICSNDAIADFMKDYIREKAEELMR